MVREVEMERHRIARSKFVIGGWSVDTRAGFAIGDYLFASLARSQTVGWVGLVGLGIMLLLAGQVGGFGCFVVLSGRARVA